MSGLNLLGIVSSGWEEVKFHFEGMDLGEEITTFDLQRVSEAAWYLNIFGELDA